MLNRVTSNFYSYILRFWSSQRVKSCRSRFRPTWTMCWTWVPCWRMRRTEEGCWSTWTSCRSTTPRFGCKISLKNAKYNQSPWVTVGCLHFDLEWRHLLFADERPNRGDRESGCREDIRNGDSAHAGHQRDGASQGKVRFLSKQSTSGVTLSGGIRMLQLRFQLE